MSASPKLSKAARRRAIDRDAELLAQSMCELHGSRVQLTVNHKSQFILTRPSCRIRADAERQSASQIDRLSS